MSVSGFPRRLPSPVGRAIVTVLRWPGGESECAEEGHAFLPCLALPCLGLGDDGNREVQPGDETRQREGRGTLVVGGVIREKVGERGGIAALRGRVVGWRWILPLTIPPPQQLPLILLKVGVRGCIVHTYIAAAHTKATPNTTQHTQHIHTPSCGLLRQPYAGETTCKDYYGEE